MLGPLLATLDLAADAARRLHPQDARKLAAGLAPQAPLLRDALTAFGAVACPPSLGSVRDGLDAATRAAIDSVETFVAGAAAGSMAGLYRAQRRAVVAQEALYPLATMLPAVSRFFVEPDRRTDVALLARVAVAGSIAQGATSAAAAAAPAPAHSTAPGSSGAALPAPAATGIVHAGNDRDARGGCSLYVPEWYSDARAWPLVVCLHGGSGHGRDFLFTWLAAARTHGALLLAPTSRERTWPILASDAGDGRGDADFVHIAGVVAEVTGRYRVDAARMLLTGMSDGATYALLAGLGAASPFTHLAPGCGVLHPRLLAPGGLAAAAGLPVYLLHGARDWMFPVQRARAACAVLREAGARVAYREIADLSHAWPREENGRILDWLGAA